MADYHRSKFIVCNVALLGRFMLHIIYSLLFQYVSLFQERGSTKTYRRAPQAPLRFPFPDAIKGRKEPLMLHWAQRLSHTECSSTRLLSEVTRPHTIMQRAAVESNEVKGIALHLSIFHVMLLYCFTLPH